MWLCIACRGLGPLSSLLFLCYHQAASLLSDEPAFLVSFIHSFICITGPNNVMFFSLWLLFLWSEDSFCDFHPLRSIETWFMGSRDFFREHALTRAHILQALSVWFYFVGGFGLWLSILCPDYVYIHETMVNVCRCTHVYHDRESACAYVFSLSFWPSVLCVIAPSPRLFFFLPLWWLWSVHLLRPFLSSVLPPSPMLHMLTVKWVFLCMTASSLYLPNVGPWLAAHLRRPWPPCTLHLSLAVQARHYWRTYVSSRVIWYLATGLVRLATQWVWFWERSWTVPFYIAT